MTVSASHYGRYPLTSAPAMPVRRHWQAFTAGIAAALHGLASAATVGVASPRDYRPARYTYLERAEMSREMGHL